LKSNLRAMIPSKSVRYNTVSPVHGMLVSEAVCAINFPSGLTTKCPGKSSGDLKVVRAFPAVTSHTVIVLCCVAKTSDLPSGASATLDVAHGTRAFRAPVAGSHTHTESSSIAVASTLPSAENDATCRPSPDFSGTLS
jgi:hypothetical protein